MEENVMEKQEKAPEEALVKKKNFNWNMFHCVAEAVLFVAVIVLCVLHFCQPKTSSKETCQPKTSSKETPKPKHVVNAEPRNGDILYINIDTVNAKYKLVGILTKDIEAEMKKQEELFKNRQSALEKKAAQFQKNYESGTLTQVQIKYAQEQLMQESEKLQNDYNTVMTDLETRQAAALKQITDAVIEATKRISEERDATFVFSYQYGGQLIDADPTKDITEEVLEILNEAY